MQKELSAATADHFSSPGAKAICAGSIVGITRHGRPLVDFPGNSGGPTEARSIVSQMDFVDQTDQRGVAVLLGFENGDQTLPVVIGVIHEKIDRIEPTCDMRLRPLSVRPEVIVDGKTIVFEATDEIVLRCGKSCVTLRKDGKIEVKGSHLVSRATGTNRIKGGSVAIN